MQVKIQINKNIIIMKPNLILKISALFMVLLTVSCSKDSATIEEPTTLTSDEIVISTKIDATTNDIADILEDQFFMQNTGGKTTATPPASILPACASVTINLTPTTWTRTIDFGTVGCPMPNGAVLKGKIIISGSLVMDAAQAIISYAFQNFYHNNVLVQGNKTVTRSLQSTSYHVPVHPVHAMALNMTFTFPEGAVYTRIGNRTRECIEGYDTPLTWNDNIYVVTGNWATTFPNTTVYSHAIDASNPIRIRMNCNYRIVKGSVSITKPNHIAVIDYGIGTCDNIATLSIDGGTPTPFTFGN